jgi:CRP/FNR family cyclic AMP-dependent transcriptional regulator
VRLGRDDIETGLAPPTCSFIGLTSAEPAPLVAAATSRHVVRGETVWQAGDRADELCIVYRGEVKDCVLGADGDEVVHVLHGPGMTIGEPGFFSVERDRSVANVAVTAAVLIRPDRRDLEPFLREHPRAAFRALEGLTATVRWAGSLIASLGTRPLTERLAMRLLELADSVRGQEPGAPVTPAVSQSTLAGMTGVSRDGSDAARHDHQLRQLHHGRLRRGRRLWCRHPPAAGPAQARVRPGQRLPP